LSHSACADNRTLRRECADHDAKAAAWIEAEAARGTIPPPLLAEAAFRILAACNACAHGRVADAIEAYAGAEDFVHSAFASRSVPAEVKPTD